MTAAIADAETTWPEPPDGYELPPNPKPERRLELTRAATIRPQRVRWLWDGRLALGTLGLLAGAEGLGKSTLAYWLAARITRGELPGEVDGQPRSVLVCATEDSWAHTVVPRLMAAGADLDRVYQVEVLSADDIHLGLSLPRDLKAIEGAARQVGAALMLLDPLMSRLGDLDTHKDSEVRKALEPLVAVADRSGMAVLGLIHHNKSGSSDPLQLVMASKAFTAVARSVHTVIRDPDDETDARRLFGSPKNNLGRADLPVLGFAIEGHAIETDEGTAWTGRLEWSDGLVVGSIHDAMRRANVTDDDRSASSEAAGWLEDYLVTQGGKAASAEIKRVGHKAGHSQDALKRARARLGLEIEHEGFPRVTYWQTQSEHPSASQLEQQLEQISRGDTPTALTAPTEPSNSQSVQLEQLEQDTGTAAPTGNRLDLEAIGRDLFEAHGTHEDDGDEQTHE